MPRKEITDAAKQRFVVPTKMLRAEILSHARAIAHSASHSTAGTGKSNMTGSFAFIAGKSHSDTENLDELDGSGWKRVVAERAHVFIGRGQPTALKKRLWSILTLEYPTTEVELADAFLMACDVNIEETDIPTLAWTLLAAREQVDIHCEDYECQVDEATKKLASRKIMRRNERIVGAKPAGRRPGSHRGQFEKKGV